MCGIYASASQNTPLYPTIGLKQLLCNRGPDHVGEKITISESRAVALLFTSTVLALRGGHVVAQPLTDPATGSTLCWNGEAWKIGEVSVEGNDGEAVLALLTSKSPDSLKAESIAHTIGSLRSISGPSAFVFHDKSHDLLYFGRDCLGRRSLLYNIDDVPGTVQFSSIADSKLDAWKEVEADGIYVLDLSSKTSPDPKVILGEFAPLDFPFPLYRFSWDSAVDSSSITSFSLGKLNSTVPSDIPILNTQSKSVEDLGYILLESLKLRVLDIPDPPNSGAMNDVRLAVLFSGGLDCTVLARMANDLVPTNQCIDLLNVAFENPRVVQASIKMQTLQASKTHTPSNPPVNADSTTTRHHISAYEACPDRITGRSAVKELRKVCPGRTWRFVAINVPYTETLAHRPKIVSLVYPHNTEMDLSIAYALYFASRGSGDAATGDNMEPIPYSTPARVLLSGLGADELFGGYTRHATAFARQNFPGLIQELELDVNRLGKRNLGRDDRVISHWGREARYPFLDELLIRWALDCPVWGKCGFGTTSLSGDEQEPDLESSKKVLRLLAWKLGLVTVAKEKKRAAS